MSSHTVSRGTRPDARATPTSIAPSRFARYRAHGVVRKAILLVGLLLLWEGGAALLDNALLFPSPRLTFVALFDGLHDGTLVRATFNSMGVLLAGYLLGVAAAAVLSLAALGSRIGADLLETLAAMFNPLPAIALLPLTMIWFGVGAPSLIVVLVHAVVWPVALSTHAGFQSTSETLRMVGSNFGLRGASLARHILLPAAFPSLLTGLKVGWAFSWRTLIASEFVFGVAAGRGGLGWFIFENRNRLETPAVFAGLFVIMFIGLAVEYLVFRVVEERTVRRWGMQR